jgi:hypothetical protein
MIVYSERKKRPGEYGIFAGHRPWPEIGAVRACGPAGALHARFDDPLRVQPSQQRSHRGLCRRTERGHFFGILDEHERFQLASSVLHLE